MPEPSEIVGEPEAAVSVSVLELPVTTYPVVLKVNPVLEIGTVLVTVPAVPPRIALLPSAHACRAPIPEPLRHGELLLAVVQFPEPPVLAVPPFESQKRSAPLAGKAIVTAKAITKILHGFFLNKVVARARIAGFNFMGECVVNKGRCRRRLENNPALPSLYLATIPLQNGEKGGTWIRPS